MIEIKNLHHHYPDGTHALRGIDLQIPGGEFLLVCGLNGSGKTTLLHLINGLLKPSSGSVRINGLDSLRDSRSVRQMVGMVFQDPDSQIVGETVEEDVAFGPENLGLSPAEVRDQVDEAIRTMGLIGLSQKPCYLLSGGEKRRLSIAGILAMKPRVILFDEPFSHLDYPGIREVLRYLVRLRRMGHTLVVTTHDVEKVIGLVDRVAILHQGEVKMAGPPFEISSELSRFGIWPPGYGLPGQDRTSWLE